MNDFKKPLEVQDHKTCLFLMPFKVRKPTESEKITAALFQILKLKIILYILDSRKSGEMGYQNKSPV